MGVGSGERGREAGKPATTASHRPTPDSQGLPLFTTRFNFVTPPGPDASRWGDVLSRAVPVNRHPPSIAGKPAESDPDQ